MSDESPTKRLSQIFESLSCLSEIHKNQQKEQPNYGNTSSSSSSSIQPSHYSVPSTPLSSTSNQNTKTNSSGQRVLIGSRSTPNSPRLMPKRSRPPAIPQRPHAALIASPALVAMEAEASPWAHFTSLTDHLDVHQSNNYHQGLPEVSFFINFFFELF